MIYEQGLIWQNVKCKCTSPEVVFADSLMLQGRGCVDCRRRKRKSESVLRVRDHSEQRARPRMGTLTGETDEAGCGCGGRLSSSLRVRGGHLCTCAAWRGRNVRPISASRARRRGEAGSSVSAAGAGPGARMLSISVYRHLRTCSHHPATPRPGPGTLHPHW